MFNKWVDLCMDTSSKYRLEKVKLWSIMSDSISLSVFQDSGPHMSVGPLRNKITSGVHTFPESSQCSCVSLTPSSCDSRVYMFCC